jgi:hypothetical protein
MAKEKGTKRKETKWKRGTSIESSWFRNKMVRRGHAVDPIIAT